MELRRIAPVVAVRGNVDTAPWAQALPETAVAEAGPILIYILHDVNALDLNPAAAGFHIVVSGHSHKPGKTERDGVVYINPGSAGPRRFHLPVTVAVLRTVALGGGVREPGTTPVTPVQPTRQFGQKRYWRCEVQVHTVPTWGRGNEIAGIGLLGHIVSD